jgi:hypothetical protein
MMTFLQGSTLPNRKKVKSAHKYSSNNRNTSNPGPGNGRSSRRHGTVEIPQRCRRDGDQLQSYVEIIHQPKPRSYYAIDVESIVDGSKSIEDKVWEDGACPSPTCTQARAYFSRGVGCATHVWDTKTIAGKDAPIITFFAFDIKKHLETPRPRVSL